MINSNVMVLNFIEEINRFKKYCEAYEPGEDQDDCKHDFNFSFFISQIV